MKKALLLILLLAACQDEVAQSTDPVPLTAETTGYYCQMNLTEHPGPKGQVHLEGLPGAPLFFSQVRDAIAYARMPEQSHPILAIWVSDMGADGATWDEPGAANWTDARTAFFVTGSALTGGMGAAELVPFAVREKAEAFAARHGGQIVTLDQIPDEAVIPPDEPATVAEDDDIDARLKALSHDHQAGG